MRAMPSPFPCCSINKRFHRHVCAGPGPGVPFILPPFPPTQDLRAARSPVAVRRRAASLIASSSSATTGGFAFVPGQHNLHQQQQHYGDDDDDEGDGDGDGDGMGSPATTTTTASAAACLPGGGAGRLSTAAFTSASTTELLHSR